MKGDESDVCVFTLDPVENSSLLPRVENLGRKKSLKLLSKQIKTETVKIKRAQQLGEQTETHFESLTVKLHISRTE